MSEINLMHELTMLYLQKKDISNLSPAELLDEYKKAYSEIKEHKAKKHGAKWTYQFFVNFSYFATVTS